MRRNRWDIVAGYFPGALVADRTALEFEPADDGSVCLVTPTGSDIDLPGLRLRPRRGAGPTAEDRPFMAGLFLSSQARAFLDNLRPSRARRGRCRRTLPRERLEAELERLIGTAGIEAVNRLRDDARRIAPQIHRDAEAELLASIIGAMAGSRDAPLANRAARARSRGMPYDPQRVALFERLQRGFDLYRALDTPFRRAVFIHFLVTEVHPFADGNGRVARIMMNAELIAANEERVVIPTVYRPDYIAAQRALSVHAQATPVMRMLDFAQRWTGAVDWTTVTETANLLRRTNAFLTEQQADAARVRLALPAAESAAPFPREPHREPN